MKKILCVFLAVAFLLPCLAGCKKETKAPAKEPEVSRKPFVPAEYRKTYDSMPQALSAIKVDSVTLPEEAVLCGVYDNGYIYRQGEQYGIITLDTHRDTGANYYGCLYGCGYYVVSATQPVDYKGDALPVGMGVVDRTGNQIIPCQYGAIAILNQNYAVAYNFTGKTTDDKESVGDFRSIGEMGFPYVEEAWMAYNTDRWMGPIINETMENMFGDLDENYTPTYYTGNWEIYDLNTGALIPDLTGDRESLLHAVGEYLFFRDAKGKQRIYNTKGEKIKASEVMYVSEKYRVAGSDNTRKVYDAEGNLLFSQKEGDYLVTGIERFDLFVGYKQNKRTGKVKCALLDATGKVISADFDHAPSPIMDQVVRVWEDNTELIYDYQGKLLTKDSVSVTAFDQVMEVQVATEEEYYKKCMLKDGTVLYDSQTEGTQLENCILYAPDSKTGTVVAYCHKTKTASISSPFMEISPEKMRTHTPLPFVFMGVDSNDTYYLQDTLSGDVLLTGYDDYAVGTLAETVKAVAATRKNSPVVDIYVIQ